MLDAAQHSCRILYLTKVFPYPPAVAGDSVYGRGLIEALASVARVTVVCADSGGRRVGSAEADWRVVGPVRSGRAKSLLSRWPLIAWKGATQDYLAEVDALLLIGGWDAIVLADLGLAHALPRAISYRSSNPAVKLIYVSHEWEYASRAGKYRSYKVSPLVRLMARIDLKKVKHWEQALVQRCDIVTAISQGDLAPFRKIDSSRKYLVLPPGYDGPVTKAREITQQTPRRVLILGGRRGEHKQQVLLDWLAVAYTRLTAAKIEISIAGDITDELRDRVHHDYPQALVLGYVDSLDSIIAEARVGVIADTVGGGFKLRLLSQVFQRLPIVGLADAVNGLPTPAGSGYLAAKDLDDLATMVCNVIDNVELLNALQNRAYSDCSRAFSWQERAQALTAVVRDQNSGLLV